MSTTGVRIASGALLVAGVAAAATPSRAIDWQGAIGFSQSLQTGGGVDSGSDDEESSLNAVTAFNFNFVGRTPRTVISLAPGVSFFLSDDDGFDSETVRPTFRGSVNTGTTDTRFNASLSFTPRFREFDSVARDALADPFPVPVDPTDPQDPEDEDTVSGRRRGSDSLQLDTNFTLGLSQALDRRNSVDAGFFARRRDYSGGDEGLTPSTTVGINTGWSTQLSSITTGSLNANVRQFIPDDSDRDASRTYGLSAGLGTRFTPLLSANGSLGIAITETEGEGFEPGLTGRFGIGYQLSRLTSLSADISQSVEQDERGELQNVLAAAAGATTQLSERSRFAVRLRAATENPIFDTGEDERVTFSLTPTYTFQVTESWSLSTSYSLRYEQETGSDEWSSRFSVQIGRSFNLF
jgi:hypothetical protein